MNYTINFTQTLGINANQTCILDQYQLIQNTAKLPGMIFWIGLIISITLLTIYIILPNFKIRKELINDIQYHGSMMATALSIWIPLVAFYFTFNLTETSTKLIETIITYTAIAAITIFGYLWWRKK